MAAVRHAVDTAAAQVLRAVEAVEAHRNHAFAHNSRSVAPVPARHELETISVEVAGPVQSRSEVVVVGLERHTAEADKQVKEDEAAVAGRHSSSET
jgi:hypothetical protein